MKILVVDDIEDNRYQLEVVLSAAGHEVQTAQHGEAALELARRNPPDLLVTDILMPVMDGFTLCRQWKADPLLCEIPVMFYTATYTDDRDRELALQMGADEFLIKPQEPEALAGAIQAILDRHAERRLEAARPAVSDEVVVMREYSETLIRKLEQKMAQLERAKLALEHQAAETERINARLRESEEKFRSVFEESNIAKCLTSPEGTLYPNRAFCQLLGYSPEELQALDWDALTHPDDLEESRRHVAEMLRGEKDSVCFTKRYSHKSGSTVWGEVHTVLLRDLSAVPLFFVTTVVDVTARVAAEEEATRTAREWQTTFDTTDDAILVIGPDLRIVRANRAACRYTVSPQAEILGRWSWEVIDGTSRPPADCPLIRARETLQRESVELRRSDRWLEVTVDPILTEAGEFGGAVQRVADVTERKLAEQRLRRQARFLDAASDAIYVRDLDHTVTYWSEGAARIFGWGQEEAVGRKITELGCVDVVEFEAAHAALLQEGSWSGELKRTSRSGTELILFCRWSLLRDDQGNPLEVLAIDTDVTEHRRLEQAYLRAQRLEAIGALAGGIAHDLNNILAPILMTASFLRESIEDPESRELIETVESCARRGAGIIQQLLTFARGKPEARVPIPVRQLLGEMEKLIRETFPRNIQVIVEATRDLWPVLGDVTQLHQALLNLCVNSRDAMPNGGSLRLAAANIELDENFAALSPGAKPGPYVCVSVADSGVGISPQDIELIFDPFFTTKEPGHGTGLGLATVLGIVRGHGGFIRVDSRPGKGAIFEMYFPASPAATASKTEAEHQVPPRGHGELILVVDDEAAMREVIRRTLEGHGYRVVVAGEGREAIEVLEQCGGQVRALLTDMMMPAMDGVTLMKELRRAGVRIPLVAMTGLAERAVAKGLEVLEPEAVLIKPFDSRQLLTVVHRVLAQSGPLLGRESFGSR